MEKQILKSILRHKRPITVVTFLSILLLVILGIGLLTSPSKDNKEQISAKQSNVKYKQEESLEIIKPEIDISASTGVDGAKIYYADEEQIIFGGYFGCFVYSKTGKEIVRALDLEAIGCYFTQGDSYCEISVSKDGDTIYMHNINQEEMYVYHVLEDYLTKKEYKIDESTLYQGLDVDNNCATYFSKDTQHNVYINNAFRAIGDLGYSEYIGEETDSSLVIPFFEEDMNSVINFEPEDIRDLIKAEITFGGKRYVVEEKESLQRLEVLLTKANEEVLGGSGCPFYFPLILERQDGVKGVIYPAADSCSIFRTEKGYFQYSEADSEEFWKIFGVDINEMG